MEGGGVIITRIARQGGGDAKAMCVFAPSAMAARLAFRTQAAVWPGKSIFLTCFFGRSVRIINSREQAVVAGSQGCQVEHARHAIEAPQQHCVRRLRGSWSPKWGAEAPPHPCALPLIGKACSLGDAFSHSSFGSLAGLEGVGAAYGVWIMDSYSSADTARNHF